MTISRDPRAPVVWHRGELTRAERWEKLGASGGTVWFTGLPSSGKSTIASAVEKQLVGDGLAAYLLDGDNVRHGLNSDLGFDREARCENIRRAAHVGRLFADAGVIALVSFVSPYAADRDVARALHEADGLTFVEVWVSTPVEECARRDPKGLYARAARGEIRGFTGLDDPYEPPASPDLTLTPDLGVPACVERVLATLRMRGCASIPNRMSPTGGTR